MNYLNDLSGTFDFQGFRKVLNLSRTDEKKETVYTLQEQAMNCMTRERELLQKQNEDLNSQLSAAIATIAELKAKAAAAAVIPPRQLCAPTAPGAPGGIEEA